MMNFHKRFPPEYFFIKNYSKNKTKYTLVDSKIRNYILDNSTSDEFIVIPFISRPKMGQTQIIYNLIGAQYKKDKEYFSDIQGALISYGGNIGEIYNRMKIEPPKNINVNRDVYFIDTESYYDQNIISFASLLISLIPISFKLVAIINIEVLQDLINLLNFCKYFIKISNETNENPFDEKLIIRIKDYLNLSGNDTENQCFFKKYFNDNSIYPIYVPGGYYDHAKRSYNSKCTKIFLDNLFSDQENSVVFNNLQDFIDKMINASNKSSLEYIKSIFKDDIIQKSKIMFDHECIEIENSIINFFSSCIEKVEYNEESIDYFFKNNVIEKYKKLPINNEINEIDQKEYIEMETVYFNKLKNELKPLVSKYTEFESKIQKSRTEKDNIIHKLQLLSEQIKDNAQFASDMISHQIKIYHENIYSCKDNILSFVKKQKDSCNKLVEKAAISIPHISDLIYDDISNIFNRLSKFKLFNNNYEIDFFERTLKYYFQDTKEIIEPVEIADGVLCYINKKTKKYSRIVIDSRKYEESFIDIIDDFYKKKKEPKDNQTKKSKKDLPKNELKIKGKQPKSITLVKMYAKNESIEENKYIFQENDVKRYIKDNLESKKFLVIPCIGLSQQGKSELMEHLTGIYHKKGNGAASTAKNATITYAGKIKDIYERMTIKPPDNKYSNYSVFFSDTEGLCDSATRGKIAVLLMPLIIMSSKIIMVASPDPASSSITDFLSLCNIYINSNEDKNRNMLKNKIIFKAKDFPSYTEDPENDIIIHKRILEENDIAKKFYDISINPTFVPSGPWDSKNHCHDTHFVKYFLDQLFSNLDKAQIFSDVDDYIQNIKGCDYEAILRLFKEKTISERVLKEECFKINDEMSRYFLTLNDTLEFDEKLIDNFYTINVKLRLEKVKNKNKIPQNYYEKYLNKEEKLFNKCKNNFIELIKKYKVFKEQIINAKNTKEKLTCQLPLISTQIKNLAQDCANHIIYCVENNFTKIDTYEHIILSYIDDVKNHCEKILIHIQIPAIEIHNNIKDDINSIFSIFKQFKAFIFYREHGFISKIIKYLRDSIEESQEIDTLAPGVYGFVNAKTDKYYKIEVLDRHYDDPDYLKNIDEHLDNELRESLDNKSKDIVFNNDEIEFDHISDMTLEKIDDLAKKYAKELVIESSTNNEQ